MPDINDITQPVSYFDPKVAEREKEIQAQGRKPDLLDTAATAFGITSPVTMMGNVSRWWEVQGMNYDVDDKFHLTKEMLDEHASDLPAERLSQFAHAHSAEHFAAINKAEHDRMEALGLLSDAGTVGHVASIGAGLADPLMLVATAASGGAAGAMQTAGTVGRLGMMVRSGMVVGSTMAGLETVNAAIDPSVTGWDIAAAGAGGFGFGAAGPLVGPGGSRLARALATGAGQAIPSTAVNLARAGFDEDRTAKDAIYGGLWSFGIGGLLGAMHAPEKLEAAATNLRKEIELSDIKQAGLKPTPKGEVYFKPVAGQAAEEAAVLQTVRPFVESNRTPNEADMASLKMQAAAPAGTKPWEMTENQFMDEFERLVERSNDEEIKRSPDQWPQAAKDFFAKHGHGETPAQNAEFSRLLGYTPEQIARHQEEMAFIRGSAHRYDYEGARMRHIREAIDAGEPVSAERRAELANYVPEPDYHGQSQEIPPVRQRAPEPSPWDAFDQRPDERGSPVPRDPVEFVDAPKTLQERVQHLVEDGWSGDDAIAQAEREAAHAQSKPGDFARSQVPEEAPGQPLQPSPEPAEGAPANEPTTEDKLLEFAKKLQTDGKKLRAQNNLPRGRNTGGAIDPITELRGLAKQALGKAIELGIKGTNELRAFIEKFMEDEAPHLKDYTKDVHRMVRATLNASLSSDNRLLPDRLTDAVGPAIDQSALHDPSQGMYDLSRVTADPIAYARMLRVDFGDKAIRIPYTPRGWTGTQQLATSDMPAEVRLVGKLLGASGHLADSAGNAPAESPSEFSQRIANRARFEWIEDLRKNQVEWEKSQGMQPTLNPFEMRERARTFAREIAKASRRPETGEGRYTDDPIINAMSKRFRDARQQELESQQRAGVHGAADIQQDRNYVPRVPLITQYNTMVADLGADAVHDLTGKALEAYNPSEDPRLTRAIGEGYWKMVLESRLHPSDTGDPLDLPIATITEILNKTLRGKPQDLIDQAVYRLTEARRATGQQSSMARRAPMDETAAIEVTGKDGQTRKVSMEDLLLNDATRLHTQASASAARRVAMAELVRAFNVKSGLTEFGDNDGALTGMRTPDELMQHLKEVLTKDNTTTNQAYLAKQTIESLQRAMDEAQGVSKPQTIWGDANKLVRLAMLLKLGGGIGLKHIANFASATMEATLPAVLRQFPTIARLATPFGSVEWRNSNEFLREVEWMTASRFDPKFNETFDRSFSDTGSEDSSNPIYNRIAGPATYVLNRLNFLSYFSRSISQFATVVREQKWLDQAFSGKLPSATRLAGEGLDPDIAARIAQNMREHSTWTEGPFGRRLRLANVNAWSDQEAASAYCQSINRVVNRVMNAPQGAQIPDWMTTDTGATLAQFKKWPMTAWDNIVMHGVQQFAEGSVADKARTVAHIGLATGLGALSYAAAQYLRSIGRKDQDAYLKKTMAPDQVALHAFSNSGFAGFSPEIADPISYMGRGKPLFGYGNEAENPLTGYPAAQGVMDLYHAGHGAMDAGSSLARKGLVYKQDAQAMQKIVPFQNSNLFYQFFNKVESNLPERPKVRPARQ